MKTLVIGAQGFLGRHFLQAYRATDPTIIGTSRKELDLASPNLDALDLTGYTHALIAAAVTSIARCEKEKEATYQCNVTGTLELIRQLHQKNIVPIAFSSDYVFDGIAGDYTEDSPIHPLNEYGRQKAQLEKGIREICGGNYLLIRLSKVFGFGDSTLLEEMAHKLRNKEPIRVAHDQIFCPIYISDVVEGVLRLQKMGCRGIFHICGQPMSRLNLAQAIAQKIIADPKLVQSISLDDLKEPFMRPKNTSMVCNKFHSITGNMVRSLSSCIDQIA